MSQLTNLAFFPARPRQTQALGSALSALVALLSGDSSYATGTTHSRIHDRLTVRLRDLRNGLPNEPPMGISAVRPGDHPARTGAYDQRRGCCRNQILRTLQ
jgi:hypothetical protein